MRENMIVLAAFGTAVGDLAAAHLVTLVNRWLDPQWAAEVDRKEWKIKRAKAERDAKLFCPHCQKFGYIATESTTVKKGISGGKATAALLTGGVSMLATGLSQEDTMTGDHLLQLRVNVAVLGAHNALSHRRTGNSDPPPGRNPKLGRP